MTSIQTATEPPPIPSHAVSFPASPSKRQPTAQVTLHGRVLLVEDGLDNQQIISLHLRKAGAEVFVAENGQIAVDLATSQPFDLILMDIEMPVLDGYAATRQLRASGCTLPIVALTAHSAAADQSKCLAAGCTGYLTKPIERNTLLTSVARYLCGGFPAIGVPAPAVSPASVAPTPAAPQPLPTAQTLRSSFADETAMQGPIAEFVDLLPYRVAIMERLLNERNLAELTRVVHQVKGAGGGYGFDAITEFAAKAEQSLRQEQPPETVVAEVESLITLVRSVEGYQLSRERFHV